MPQYKQMNYWSHKNSLNNNWYSGETGIPILDDAIKESALTGYTHHINRLMIISNLMNLSNINPNEIYRWFMEMYVDSADWVMVPNVYGMGTYADGGIFLQSLIFVAQVICLECQITKRETGAMRLMVCIGNL